MSSEATFQAPVRRVELGALSRRRLAGRPSGLSLKRLPRKGLALLLVPLLAGSAVVGLSEYLHWRASEQRYPNAGSRTGAEGPPDVVLVLGYPSGGRFATALQRWRTDVAVRSAGEGGRLLFSGAATQGMSRSEAAVMAEDAQERHEVPRGRIVLEQLARSTTENVALALPLMDDANTIAVASSPLHVRVLDVFWRSEILRLRNAWCLLRVITVSVSIRS